MSGPTAAAARYSTARGTVRRVSSDTRADGISNCLEGLGDPSVDTRLQTYRTWGWMPSCEELEQEWAQNWMAYVEVTLIPQTMFRAGYDLVNVEPPVDQATLKSYAEGDLAVQPDGSIERTKGLAYYAKMLEIQGRKLGGAALFPILRDGLDPSEPLNVHRIERVVDWVVFDRSEITPIPSATNQLPTYYMLSDVVALTKESHGTRPLQPGDIIHWTRLWFHYGREGISHREQRNRQWWGISVLELNRRQRMAAERAGEYLSSFIAKCSWLHYSQAELDEMMQRPDGEQYLRRRYESLRKNATSFGMVVTDGGRGAHTDAEGNPVPERKPDKVESIIESVGDLQTIKDGKDVEWARGAGLPASIAFSETAAGLRGGENGGDWQKFGGDVQDAQTGATMTLNWMYTIVFSSKQGPTNGMLPDSWTIVWRPLRLPTQMELAAIAKAWAEADEVRIRSKVAKPEQVREQRLVLGDIDGQLRVSEDEPESEAAVVGPAQVGIATAYLEGARAVALGEVPPEFLAGYLEDIDAARFPPDVAARRAEAARPKTPLVQPGEGTPMPGAAPADPLVQTLELEDAEAEEPEPFSTDPRPSDLMLPGDLAAIVTARFGHIAQGSQSINAMARRKGLRRWPVGTKSGYSKAEIIAAYEGDVAEPESVPIEPEPVPDQLLP